MRYESLLDAIGNTPLVRLQRIPRHLKPAIYAKLEFINPGGSVKDRIALRMLLQAEREGKIKPGGTIIECTSGNTGMGLAMAAALRGYRAIFTTTDKQSREKINMLKAMGAEVIVCPTAVAPDDPRQPLGGHRQHIIVAQCAEYFVVTNKQVGMFDRMGAGNDQQQDRQRVAHPAAYQRQHYQQAHLLAAREVGVEGHRAAACAEPFGCLAVPRALYNGTGMSIPGIPR